MPMINLFKDKAQIIIFIFIVYFGFSIYVLDVRSVTWDDQSMYTSDYHFGIGAAYAQARIGHFFNAFLMPVPYFFDSHIYFKTVQMITNIAFIVSIGALISILFRNRHLWYVYSILAFTLWQNSDGHNLMVAYPFYIGFSIFTLSLSLIFFIYYLRSNKNTHLLFSLLAWLLTYKGTEFYLMYAPVFFIIAYYESDKNILIEKLKDVFIKIKWHILATFTLFVIYIVFRISVGSEYGGRTLSLDFNSFLTSWLTYSVGLAPGVQFYYNFKDYSIPELIQLIDFNVILVSMLTMYSLISLKDKIQQISLNSKYYFLIVAYLILVPNFLISWTVKYQYYVDYHDVNNYLYSSYSFFAILFVVIFVLIKAKKSVHYNISVLILTALVLLTQVNNKFVGMKQAHYSEKYFLLDTLLESSYLDHKKSGFTILAPTLWDEMTVTKDYWIKDAWTRYSKKKVKEEVRIVRYADDKDAKAEYIVGGKNKSSFLTYSESNKLKAIFLSSEKCNKIHPCYLLSTYPSLNGGVMYGASIANGLVYKTQVISLPDQENIYGISTYHIKGDIDDRQMTMLLEYDPTLDTQKVVDFDEGFYALEQDGGNQWIWAFGNGKINIKSPIDIKAQLMISLRTASKRTIKFKLNDKIYEMEFKDNKLRDIAFPVDLNKGNNTLEILSNAQPIKLSKADDRVFSYAIFDIKIMDIDGVEKID